MNKNQSRKKMAVIFSAVFICCSIPLCKMNAYAANTGELQSGTILAQKNSDEENDTVSEQIPAGVHKDTHLSARLRIYTGSAATQKETIF